MQAIYEIKTEGGRPSWGGARAGAGRPKRRKPIDAQACLSVAALERSGLLWPGARGSLAWIGGGGPRTDIRASDDMLAVSGFAGGQRIDLRLRIERVPCRFGGSRPWLLCPGCGKRTARLYLHRARVECRKCAGLVYASQVAPKARSVSKLAERDCAALDAPDRAPTDATTPAARSVVDHPNIQAEEAAEWRS